MTTEEVFAKYKPRQDAILQQGRDCLVEKLGEVRAELFLQLSHCRRTEESMGRDYTAWHESQEELPFPKSLATENVKKLQAVV
jgi:hypothetical protein